MIDSAPVGIARVKRGAPFMVTTISVLLLPMSMTICGCMESCATNALVNAKLSGSKAITSKPIDSSMSSRCSTKLFSTLDSNTSTLVLSLGESPITAQSILDFSKGVGISESA